MAGGKKEERQEVKKHSASIQIENNITLLQRKAWNVMLWHAYDDLPTKDIHEISVRQIMCLVGYNSKDEAYLKEALDALSDCKVKWNILDKDGSTDWGFAVLLASASIKNGICSYGFAPHLRQKLYSPDMFARLDLDMQKRFDSKYALALWELCIDYLGGKRDYGETPWIEVENFRRLMGVKESEYYAGLFKELNRKIIVPSIAEINRVSDFHVTVEYQRQGRKVTALKFKICRVTLLPEAQSEQGQLFPNVDDMPAVVKELQDVGLSSQDTWEIWQQGFRYVDESVRPAMSHEDADAAFVQYVREKIHLLKRLQASDKVNNSTGFLLNALRHNYANPEFIQEAQRQAAAQEQAAKRTRETQYKVLEAEKASIEHARDQALHALYLRLAQEAPDVLEQAVPLLLQENYLFRQFYQWDQSALANYQARAMLQMGFNPYLAQHAPTQVAAVEQHYATQLAAVETQLVALS